MKAVISCLRLLPSSSSVRTISFLIWTWPLALRLIVCLIHCTHSYGKCLAWSGADGAMLSRKNPLFNTAGFAGRAADARHLLNPSVRLNIGGQDHRCNQATQVCLPVDVPCAGHGRPSASILDCFLLEKAPEANRHCAHRVCVGSAC